MTTDCTPSESPLSSQSYQSSYISRRYSVQTPLTSTIRPVTTIRPPQLDTETLHTVRPRSVPNIKFSSQLFHRPQPLQSGWAEPGEDATGDNIETQLENLCLSVTEKVLEK